MNDFLKNLIESPVKRFCEIRAEAQSKADEAKEKRQKEEEDRTTVRCPHCGELHEKEYCRGAYTRKDYIKFNQGSHINLILCKKCKTLFCIAIYIDSCINGNVIAKGYRISDKEDIKGTKIV